MIDILSKRPEKFGPFLLHLYFCDINLAQICLCSVTEVFDFYSQLESK